MKFQNPNILRSKVSNFTEKWKHQNFNIPYFCQNFDKKFSKVNQVIYSSAPTSIPNMKALAQYLAHKIFKFCFQRDITQKRGIT